MVRDRTPYDVDLYSILGERCTASHEELKKAQRVSTPFLRAETLLKHENQKFDQTFDFGERGYFGITKKISATKNIPSG